MSNTETEITATFIRDTFEEFNHPATRAELDKFIASSTKRVVNWSKTHREAFQEATKRSK